MVRSHKLAAVVRVVVKKRTRAAAVADDGVKSVRNATKSTVAVVAGAAG